MHQYTSQPIPKQSYAEINRGDIYLILMLKILLFKDFKETSYLLSCWDTLVVL
jgi:hypothetical protein